MCNHKRTYRLYREEKLQVRRKRRKTLHRPHVPMSVPTARTQRWSMDFVSDQLANARRIRVLNVVDDHTRECIGQLVDVSISGGYVARFLDQLIERNGRPTTIVCDNVLTLESRISLAQERLRARNSPFFVTAIAY